MVLDFYMCYRAVVRAKVYGFMHEDPALELAERFRDLAKARAYFPPGRRVCRGRAALFPGVHDGPDGHGQELSGQAFGPGHRLAPPQLGRGAQAAGGHEPQPGQPRRLGPGALRPLGHGGHLRGPGPAGRFAPGDGRPASSWTPPSAKRPGGSAFWTWPPKRERSPFWWRCTPRPRWCVSAWPGGRPRGTRPATAAGSWWRCKRPLGRSLGQRSAAHLLRVDGGAAEEAKMAMLMARLEAMGYIPE